MTNQNLDMSRVDLTDAKKTKVIGILQHQLYTAIDLHLQLKAAHWNVQGMHFIQLHELFDDMTDKARDWADKLAERIATLGGEVKAGTADIQVNSQLQPYSAKDRSGKAQVTLVSNALAEFANGCREAIDLSGKAGDAVTEDLFTGIAGEADLQLWFAEAHLK